MTQVFFKILLSGLLLIISVVSGFAKTPTKVRYEIEPMVASNAPKIKITKQFVLAFNFVALDKFAPRQKFTNRIGF